MMDHKRPLHQQHTIYLKFSLKSMPSSFTHTTYKVICEEFHELLHRVVGDNLPRACRDRRFTLGVRVKIAGSLIQRPARIIDLDIGPRKISNLH